MQKVGKDKKNKGAIKGYLTESNKHLYTSITSSLICTFVLSITTFIMENRICDLFKIQYPIIQGGMVWCSGWELVSAVSNNGGLGLLGAGSMNAEVLAQQIDKVRATTQRPFGVNLPLLKPEIEALVNVIIDKGVKIVFTSAGNPKTWTKKFQDHNIVVAHVVANTKFAKKCEEAGVDAIVAEGFEAGGHNGREETTTLSLIPHIRKTTTLPLIAAGGIASGSSMYATMALGAEGVQIGSLFASAKESSAHDNFKQRIIDSREGSTQLSLKTLTPVRLIKNEFYQIINDAEYKGRSKEELQKILGKGRSKHGIFEGDMINGELEIGQVSAIIDQIDNIKDIMQRLVTEFNATSQKMNTIQL